MTNYDMDELQRNEDKRKKREKEEDYRGGNAVTLEIPDDMIVKLAMGAHEKDITLNKYINIALRDGLKNSDYQYEHPNTKQVLKEY